MKTQDTIPNGVAPISPYMRNVVTDLGWEVYDKTLESGIFAIAMRGCSLNAEDKESLDCSALESTRRKIIFGHDVVTIVAEPPLLMEDARTISKLEDLLVGAELGEDQDELAATKREVLVREDPFEGATDKQRAVIQRILLPESEIADELGISTESVADRLKTVRMSLFESKMELAIHALHAGQVDLMPISPVSTLVLPNELQQYIAEEGVHARENAKMWRRIHTMLGSKTKYEVYAMAARDDTVNLKAIMKSLSEAYC